MIAPIRTAQSPSHADLQASFMAILPAIKRVATYAFRRWTRDERDELIAEVIASAWPSFCRLIERGKDPTTFPTALARFAVCGVKEGRRIGRRHARYDLLSSYCRTNGTRFESLEAFQASDPDLWEELLIESRNATPADTAAARLDFAAWLRKLTGRRRRIAKALAVGERACDVADRFGVSRGRITQLRQEFKASWAKFHGESAAAAA